MQHLFPRLTTKEIAALAQIADSFTAALPMRPHHRQQLPLAIAELSARLTAERGMYDLPYWSTPRLFSAYMWYFLPWNILRLMRLFKGLALPAPEARITTSPAIIDLGSGPLTVPLSLWLSYPQWRNMPLSFVCIDTAGQPMELGARIFAHLTGGTSPWRLILRKNTVQNIAREVYHTGVQPWLITSANVLNELRPRPYAPIREQLNDIVTQTAQLISQKRKASSRKQTQPAALFIEPGTRLGGKIIMDIRAMAVEHGLHPISPCTMCEQCPLQQSRTWCHFSYDTQGAPDWLQVLSHAAHLDKESISLAFTLLQREPAIQPPQEPSTKTQSQVRIRILSAPMRITNIAGLSHYGCSARGLVLVQSSQPLEQGMCIEMQWPDKTSKDLKSQAWLVTYTPAASQTNENDAQSDRHRTSGDKKQTPPTQTTPARARTPRQTSRGKKNATPKRPDGDMPTPPKRQKASKNHTQPSNKHTPAVQKEYAADAPNTAQPPLASQRLPRAKRARPSKQHTG